MRRVLLDTHVVVTLAGKGGLETMPTKVQRMLENPDVELLLSVVSEVEVAIKSRLGKLDLAKEDLRLICRKASIISYPLRPEHADKLFALPSHHQDPFDRMIISTALCDDLPIISGDTQFRKYKGLRIVW